MFWENLRQNQCVKCGGNLTFISRSGVYVCEEVACDFKINKARFKEIAMDENEAIFDGFCQDCGRKIPPRYRLCYSCEKGK